MDLKLHFHHLKITQSPSKKPCIFWVCQYWGIFQKKENILTEDPWKNKLFDEYFDKVRDARVHWFKCGWLSCQYRTLISQIAILLVSMTSHGRCCYRDNTIWSNSYKRTNYSSNFWWVHKSKYFLYFVHTKMFHL